MRNDEETVLICFVSFCHGTLLEGLIRTTLTVAEIALQLNRRLVLDHLLDKLAVGLPTFLDRFVHPERVIVGDILLSRPCNRIMMQIRGQSLQHVLLLVQNLRHFRIFNIFLEHSLRKQHVFCIEDRRSILSCLLRGWPGRVVAVPHLPTIGPIGHAIFVPHRPFYLLLLKCVDVFARRRHFERDVIGVLAIHEINHPFEILVFRHRILVGKIAAPRNKNLAAKAVIVLGLDEINEVIHQGLRLEGSECFVCLYEIARGVAIAYEEAFWLAVVIDKDVCQQLVLIAEIARRGPPQEVHRSLADSLILFRLVQSTKEQCLKPHLRKQPRTRIRVPKHIDIPCDPRRDSESLLNKLMTDHHIVNNIVKIRAPFIIVNPATVNEFQLLVFDELLDGLLCLVILLLPPRLQIARRRLRELSVRVFRELINDRIENQLHTGHLLALVGARVVLVNCLDPSDILMGVWNEMDCQLLILIHPSLRRRMHNFLPRLGLNPQLLHFLLHSFHVFVTENLPRLHKLQLTLLQHTQLLPGQNLILVSHDQLRPHLLLRSGVHGLLRIKLHNTRRQVRRLPLARQLWSFSSRLIIGRLFLRLIFCLIGLCRFLLIYLLFLLRIGFFNFIYWLCRHSIIVILELYGRADARYLLVVHRVEHCQNKHCVPGKSVNFHIYLR